MQKSLAQMFTEVVKGQNIMTPNFVCYQALPRGVAEITYGTGFHNEPIYGVTVVMHGKNQYKLSKCVLSYESALEYVREIRTGAHDDLIEY